MLRYVHVLRLVVWEVSVGRRMCDFTRSSAASTAEHSHVYGKDLKRGEAVIRSFTVPQIRSAISLSDSPSNTHTSVYRISSLPPPHTDSTHPPLSIPIRAHLAITSLAPPPQRNQFRLLLHTVMACWPREMESFQVLGYNLPPPPLPLRRCPRAASQHFLSTPGVSAG